MPAYDSPNLSLAYTGTFPDHLKLIKTISVFPVEVTAVATLNPRTATWSGSISARDTLVGGRITYDRDTNSVEYRKSLPLSVFGGLTRPVLAASWQLGTEWRRAPRLQLGLAMADEARSPLDDSATLGTNGTVAFRKKAFVTRRWGLEVDGDLRLQMSRDLAGGGGGLGGNSMRVEVAAKELNLVLRV